MSRTAANPTSTAKARHTWAALPATVRTATVRTVAAEIAGVAGVQEAAVVVDVAAADVVVVTAEAAVVAATEAVADQAVDGTNGRLHSSCRFRW